MSKKHHHAPPTQPKPYTLTPIIYYAFHILLFTTPFIWVSTTSELFEFPKMLFTYAMAVIITSLWLCRMVFEKKFIFQKTYLDIPLFLFLLSQIISTIFSIDPHTSLFGYYSRFHGGLLSTLAYISLYYAAVSNLNLNHVKGLIKTILASAILTSLYSFPEHFGHSPSCFYITNKFDVACWVQDVKTRVFGTFGQPNWQAAYIITVLFIPLSKLLQIDKKQKGYWLRVTGYGLLTTLLFAVLLFTKSRSGLLGLGLGIFIFTSTTFIKSVNKQQLIRLFLIPYSLFLILFLSFGTGIFAKIDRLTAPIRDPFTPRSSAQPNEVGPPPPKIQGAQLEIGGTESGDIRKIVWTGAYKLFLKYPLFGSGVETFGYAYYNVRPTEHNLVSEWDFLYNKAHNEFLNFLATTGLFGLASYLAIMLIFTIYILKNLSKPYPLSPIPLLAGFWALTVSNFFGFSTVPVATLFFLFPAFTHILTNSEQSTIYDLRSKTHDLRSNIVIILISLVGLFLLYRISIGYTADTIYNKGKQYLDYGDVPNAYDLLKKAVSMVPNEALYTDRLSLTAGRGATALLKHNQATDAARLAQQAYQLSNLTLNLNRVHLNFYKTRTALFLDLSQINPQYVFQAEQSIQSALKLAPTDAKLYYHLGLIKLQQKDTELAQTQFEKAISLRPNYESARQDLAEIYLKNNQPDLAKEQYQYIIDHINPNNPTAKAYLVNL